jgi:hypothetical protein
MPIVGRLDQFGSMIVTGEFNEVGYTTITGIGESSFITPGTFSWTVPTGVDTISVVTVGGGGGGGGAGGSDGKGGGGGGALAYVNSISVTPGETLTVGVGTSGRPGIVPTSTASAGGNSYIKRGAISLVEAGGGQKGNDTSLDGNRNGGAGGTVIVGSGGAGGNGGAGDGGGGGGGGGAGGYSGKGGNGNTFGGDGNNGIGGAGGGGGGANSNSVGGGGVGILGEGASGAGGSSNAPGNGGSGGENGSNTGTSGSVLVGGGKYGGGGGGGTDSSGRYGNVGGHGAVRIIWGLGANRQFPATGTGVLTETYAKANISGLGTYTALEFKENIGTATTIRANVFAPYQIVEDEFAGVLYGPGQGTFMRQELNGNVIVYNEINEIGLSESYSITPQSTSINEGGTVTFSINTNNVPDGTELYYEIVDPIGSAMNLDVFNASSYNGSGTAWTDVSGTSNSGTLTNGPTYNSLNGGSIVLSGVNDYINLSNKPLPLINVSQFTYSTFIKIISGSTYGMFFSFGNDGFYANDITFYYYPTNGTLNFQVNNGGDGGASFAYTIGSWSHISVVYDGTQASNATRLKVYLNGILQTLTFDGGYTVPATTSSNVFTGAAIGIYSTSGFSDVTHMTGFIRTAQLYNKALSASQILQNYNTLNNRYSELVLNLDAGNASSYPGSGTTWTDLSSAKNGTLVNGPTYSSANGGCIIFDGANDYVNIGVGKGVNQFSGDFAISVWVMADSTGSTFGNIVGDYYTGSVSTTNEWQLMMSNGAQISFYRVGTGSIFNIASGYSANTWINVVVSRIGSTITLYTNSNSIATATNSNIFGTATGNLNIGIDGNNAQEPFKGRIADVKIYDKGLSASEVLQNFNALRGRYGL